MLIPFHPQHGGVAAILSIASSLWLCKRSVKVDIHLNAVWPVTKGSCKVLKRDEIRWRDERQADLKNWNERVWGWGRKSRRRNKKGVLCSRGRFACVGCAVSIVKAGKHLFLIVCWWDILSYWPSQSTNTVLWYSKKQSKIAEVDYLCINWKYLLDFASFSSGQHQ